MAMERTKQLKDLISKNKIKYVDYKFIDVPGTWQHKTHPISELTDDIFISGLLTHAHSLLALCSPSTNSYKRLVPGYEAPVNLVFSSRNRSAAVRIPMYSDNPKTKRIEFRPPDSTCNPYLAFAAMLMAGLDGIKNKIDPLKIRTHPYELYLYYDA